MTTEGIAFIIPGVPVAQPRQRHAVRGGFVANYTPSKHPVNTFKAVAILAAKAACKETLDGPIDLWLTFIMPRPAGMMWKKKPTPRAWHVKKPDIDNLIKSCVDAMTTAGVWRDDSQICRMKCAKFIAAGDEQPHVLVQIFDVETLS